MPLTPSEFHKRRRGRPPRGSDYRTFIKGLRPNKVAEYPLDPAKDARGHEGQRSALHWAAKAEGVAILTTIDREAGVIHVMVDIEKKV